MNFEIFDREKAIRYSYKKHDKKSIIISISDIEQDFPNFHKTKSNGIIDKLYLFFDDKEEIKPFNYITEKEKKKAEDNNKKIIQDSDAQKIADFVNKYKDKVDTIIVHCQAGISRSAGVCAAISLYLTGHDEWVFNNGYYVPNMTCYRKVLNAFGLDNNPTMLKQKESLNIQAWREKNRWI